MIPRMRKPMAVITVVLLAAGLAGCEDTEQGYYDDIVESGTVCVDGYAYTYGFMSQFPDGFDMEPTGRFCETEK